MRALVLVAALLGLAGCPAKGGCPVDTVSSASRCVPIGDMSVPDLGGCVGPAPFCSIYNGPSICLGSMWWCEGVPRDLGRVSD